MTEGVVVYRLLAVTSPPVVALPRADLSFAVQKPATQSQAPHLGTRAKLGMLAWACRLCFHPTRSDLHDSKGRPKSKQPWAVGGLPGALP